MGSSTQRVLLTIVISVAVLVAWQYFFASKEPPPAQQGQQGPQAGQAGDAGEGPARPKPEPARAEQDSAAARARGDKAEGEDGAGERAAGWEGKDTTIDTPEAVARFTTVGGALRSWTFKNPRFQEQRKGGKLAPIDLVRVDRGPWPLTTTFPDSDFEVPADAAFERTRASKREVMYRWASSKVRVHKHYVVDRARSVVWMTLTVRNLTDEKLRQRLRVSLFNQQDPGEGKAGFTNPYPRIATVLCHINGELERRSAAAIRGEDTGCSAAGCGMGEGPVNQTGEVLWIGSDAQYFLTSVIPLDLDENRRCELSQPRQDVVRADLLFPEKQLLPGKTTTRRFAIFVGPKDLEQLDMVEGPEGGEVKLSESIQFGMFAILCRPMLWLMKQFHTLVGNWGLAIIMLTIVVKLLTLYWTQKSMRSMKAMQRLKPKMDALREKYGDDKQRLNQEMMALYKVHKVNPLGGCLPMLIQFPIWYALFRTLGNAVELYRSEFIWYIKDLTAPDPYYALPILMGAAMYGQQAITPQPVEGTQAKIMKYFMPGMFTVMMLALPSGLTLYIFTNTVLTMIHQWYMNKTDPGLPLEGKGKKGGDRPSKGAQGDGDSSPSKTEGSGTRTGSSAERKSDKPTGAKTTRTTKTIKKRRRRRKNR